MTGDEGHGKKSWRKKKREKEDLLSAGIMLAVHVPRRGPEDETWEKISLEDTRKSLLARSGDIRQTEIGG